MQKPPADRPILFVRPRKPLPPLRPRLAALVRALRHAGVKVGPA